MPWYCNQVYRATAPAGVLTSSRIGSVAAICTGWELVMLALLASEHAEVENSLQDPLPVRAYRLACS